MDLTKAKPKERLERLKDLVERRKREMEHAQKLIQKTEDQIQQEKFGKINIPDEEVSLDRYGVLNKKETKKQETEAPLEHTVAESAPKIRGEEHPKVEQDYINALSQRPIEELTNEIYQIAKEVGDHTPSEYQLNRIDVLDNALYEKNKAIERGDYPANERLLEEVNLNHSLAQTLKRDYDTGKQLQFYKGGAL